MSLTASALVTAAKRRAFGSTGRQKVSDAMLLEELNYQDSLIVQMVSQIAPDLLTTVTGSDSITLAENTSGYTLSAGIHYRDFVHVDSADDAYVPINLVQRQHRERVQGHPAGMLHLSGNQGVFYPIDPAGDRWTGDDNRNWFSEDEGHSFTYSYVPEPGGLTALSDTLTAPDMARELIVSSLELSILLANPALPEARIQAGLAKRQGALDSFRMQLYKFAHPQGHQPGGARLRSDTDWVTDQVSG